MRNISFAATIDQIKNQSKDITRRMKWKHLKVGQLLQPVNKTMGFKKGQKPVYISEPIEVTKLTWEPVQMITPEECVREGFPEMTPEQFITMFCKMNKCQPTDEIHRIEFKYLKPPLMSKIATKTVISELKNELRHRNYWYPIWLRKGQITKANAEAQLKMWQFIIKFVSELHEGKDLQCDKVIIDKMIAAINREIAMKRKLVMQNKLEKAPTTTRIKRLLRCIEILNNFVNGDPKVTKTGIQTSLF